MDGPNVTLKVCKEFLRLYKEEHCHCSIDIGTCSLHIVHNSFRTGVEAIWWNIKKVLNAATWDIDLGNDLEHFYEKNFLSKCKKMFINARSDLRHFYE